MNRTVYVSGIGVASSIGIGSDEFNKSLFDEVSGIKEVSDMEICKYYAKMKDFSFEEEINKLNDISSDIIKKAKLCTRRKNEIIKSSTLAALEAYIDAGLHKTDYDRNRIGIIIGGSNLSQFESFEINKKYSDNIDFVPSSYAIDFLDTNILGIISEILNIQGEGFTVGGASASSNLAIVKGFQMIKYGIADICVIVGPMTKLSMLELSAFNNLSVIGSDIYSPFDKTQDGFVPGEASSCIILESENSIKKRNVDVDIELCSAVSFLDGNRLTNPSIEGEKNVMKIAVENAGINLSDVDYINAHGTGTPLGDKCELQAIYELFDKNVYVNSSKSFIGHCLYSAGITEAIATILQIKNNYLHTNLNLKNPINESINFITNHNIKTKTRYALNNSFGFSGINTSVLFKNIR